MTRFTKTAINNMVGHGIFKVINAYHRSIKLGVSLEATNNDEYIEMQNVKHV